MHILLEDKASYKRYVEKYVDLKDDAVEIVQEKKSMDDTRGVGKEKGHAHIGFEDGDIVGCRDYGRQVC